MILAVLVISRRGCCVRMRFPTPGARGPARTPTVQLYWGSSSFDKFLRQQGFGGIICPLRTHPDSGAIGSSDQLSKVVRVLLCADAFPTPARGRVLGKQQLYRCWRIFVESGV